VSAGQVALILMAASLVFVLAMAILTVHLRIPMGF
jgi:hypothetical protein